MDGWIQKDLDIFIYAFIYFNSGNMKILILSLPLVFRFDEFTKDGNNPTERHLSYLHFLKIT